MEFALVIPVFSLMMIGTFQYGVLLFVYTAMEDTARDASRKLAIGAATRSDAEAQARAALPTWIAPGSWTIATSDPGGANANVSTSISIPSATATVFSLAPMPATLSASVIMRKEG